MRNPLQRFFKDGLMAGLCLLGEGTPKERPSSEGQSLEERKGCMSKSPLIKRSEGSFFGSKEMPSTVYLPGTGAGDPVYAADSATMQCDLGQVRQTLGSPCFLGPGFL